MAVNERIDSIEMAVRKVAVFKAATEEDVRAIARLGITRGVEQGAYFFFQGDVADYFYILLDGHAKLCQLGRDGQQVNLRTLAPGQLFGAIGVVEPGATYPACAEAVEESTALAVESAAFREMVAARPHLQFGLMRLMTGYIQEIQQRFRELATERVEQRIARALLRLASQCGRKVPQGVLIEQLASRENLAEMTGSTIYTVSRTLSAWEKEGLIATGRERVTLTEPHALVRIAEDLSLRED